MSRCPWLAARCRGVSSPRFMTLMRAPLMMSMSTTLERPSRHAQCRGLKPWSSLSRRSQHKWWVNFKIHNCGWNWCCIWLITLARMLDSVHENLWWKVWVSLENREVDLWAFLVQSLRRLPVPLHHLGTTDDAFYFPHGSHLLFGKHIKIICLIELGPRTFSRRTTWWCDLRTEGGLLNELESEPSAFHNHQVAGLCSHTQMISAQNGIGGPTEPLSPTTSLYLCIWEPCCHTKSNVGATSCQTKRPNRKS